MAAQIDTHMTLDDVESDILYTRAALEADPDASDLLSTTDSWLGMIDAVRAKGRDARTIQTRAAARRRIAGGRLDAECTRFGDALYLAVGKDRNAARWTRFFSGSHQTPSSFVRQAIRTQLTAVTAWLGVTGDDVLDAHRDPLTKWSGAMNEALDLTASTTTARGAYHVAREQLAEDLTRARDGLEATLVQRADERGLARDWPGLFFQTRR